MKRIMLFLAVVALLVGSAFAQVEVSGSYQFTEAYVNGASVSSNPGWNASLFVPFKGGLGVVGDWSGTDFNYSTASGNVGYGTPALNTFAGGLQYQFNHKGRLRPYVNVVLGDSRYSIAGITANAFSQQAGGGIDLGLSKHFAIRAGLDYLHVDSPNSFISSANGIRPLAGVVFRF